MARWSSTAGGKLYLNGDTGISAGVKDELASIKGQPRIIPIFSTVSGNGNNAQLHDRQVAGDSHHEREAHRIHVAKECDDPGGPVHGQGRNSRHDHRHEQLRVFASRIGKVTPHALASVSDEPP